MTQRTVRKKIKLASLRFHLNQPDPHHKINLKQKEPSLELEKQLWKDGYEYVCGIDEAGRGALAGPLVSGAVILKKQCRKLPYRDSKQLSAKERIRIFKHIRKNSLAWAFAISPTDEIDKFGIQSATYLCFKRAIENLKLDPHFLLIDYYRLPAVKIKQKAIKFGDSISFSIAAASIVAKVIRDQIMNDLGQTETGKIYELKKNLGYGTRKHKEQIINHGISHLHRKCFCKFDLTDQKSFNFFKE